MTETQFRKELQDGLKAMGFWFHKISDRAIGEIKPFDLVGSVKGRFWAIECKITNARGLNLDTRVVSHSDMEPHQIKSLLDVERTPASGAAWVAACIYNLESRIKYAWLIPINSFREHSVWTIGDLEKNARAHRLHFKSGVGWLLVAPDKKEN